MEKNYPGLDEVVNTPTPEERKLIFFWFSVFVMEVCGILGTVGHHVIPCTV